MFVPTVTFAQKANLDLVKKFAPWLGFDSEAAGNGYPMSPQKFRDQSGRHADAEIEDLQPAKTGIRFRQVRPSPGARSRHFSSQLSVC